MTSDSSSILKFMYKHDQPLLEYSTPNSRLHNRLLSPITEHSAETLSTNKTCSDTSQKSPNIVLTNDNLTTDKLNQILLQRFHQYITNFQNIQNYLNTLDQHLKELSIIINCLRNDKKLINSIEPIETRLLQIRVKRDQIDRLLNQSSIKNLIQQVRVLKKSN
jgi:hypothetical protein